MLDKLNVFYTVDSNIDCDENDYCINCNFELLFNKINELIDAVNEMKGMKNE